MNALTKETGQTVLSCGHVFHLKCIVTWLQREEGAGTCPCCRAAPTEHEQLSVSNTNTSDNSDTGSYSSEGSGDDSDAGATGITALMDAAAENNVTRIQELLRGNTLHARDSDGETALFYAAILDHPATLQTLLDAGADINAKNERGETPLIRASEELAMDTLEILIQRGADASVVDNNGNTALSHAAIHGMMRGVRALVPVTTDPSLRGKAFLSACEYANAEAIVFLLGPDANVPIDFCDADGSTGLMRVLSRGASADWIAILLLKMGARADLVDADGWSCLSWMAHGENDGDTDRAELMDLLLEKGAPWRRGGDGVWRRSIQIWADEGPPPAVGMAVATTIQKTWRGWTKRRDVCAAKSLMSLREIGGTDSEHVALLRIATM